MGNEIMIHEEIHHGFFAIHAGINCLADIFIDQSGPAVYIISGWKIIIEFFQSVSP